MKIENVTALLMEALEAQCSEGEAPRLMMVETDDMSAVSLEGSFDVRAIAARVAQGLPREPIFTASEAGSVQFDGKGGLTINIAPGALGKIG
ncbi:hypothetical protein [Henriciella aquimarina]|uniref:hypothetical protein n=1 Tax=Henriciella aquimarina TaxID=545261 RepID=UPI0009FCD685|nr:hypothetical protein [Henriciella aquimarina]